MTELAFGAAWGAVERPEYLDQEDWTALVQAAQDDPSGVAAQILGWRRAGAALVRVQRDARVVGAEVGFLASAVSAGLGASAQATGVVGAAAAVVAAVVRAALGVWSARYRPKDE